MYAKSNFYYKELGEAWIECMRDIVTYGTTIFDADIPLREIRNYYFTLANAYEEDDVLQKYADKKRIELMKEKYVSCDILKGYNMSYGKLLYDNKGINQIEWVIERLSLKPETKSATIVMHAPGENELSCLSLLDFKLRNNKLNMSVVYRSQNVFGSQPGNFIALEKVQNYIATRLHVEKGEIEGIILSAHIYEYDMQSVKNILSEYDKR